jgi:short subunit dehydrogenase-like uncharacterized protein
MNTIHNNTAAGSSEPGVSVASASVDRRPSRLRGSLCVYGAYGKTGRMIAKVASERGHEVVLAGSDRDRLNRLSAEMGLPAVPVGLNDAIGLRQLIRTAACVLHVAGPFAETFRPMLEACSSEGVPYLDLNGELDVFRALEDFVDRQRPTIPVLTGSGFGVTAGAKLHDPKRIWLGLAPDLGLRSPGGLASTFRTLAQVGAVVEDGEVRTERAGRRSYPAVLGGRNEHFISMPLGELWAIRRSTGVPSIVAGVATPMAERILVRSGALGVLARSEKIRDWLVKHLARDSRLRSMRTSRGCGLERKTPRAGRPRLS